MKWHALQPPVHTGQATSRRGLILGAGLTLLLLVGLLVLFRLSDAQDASDAASEQQAFVIETELLRWGEVEPDMKSLPNIANPRPGKGEVEVEKLPEETQGAATGTVDLHPEATQNPVDRTPGRHSAI